MQLQGPPTNVLLKLSWWRGSR